MLKQRFVLLLIVVFLIAGCQKKPLDSLSVSTPAPSPVSIRLLRVEIDDASMTTSSFSATFQEALQSQDYTVENFIFTSGNDEETMEKVATGEIDLAILLTQDVTDECLSVISFENGYSLVLSKADASLFESAVLEAIQTYFAEQSH